MSIDAWAGRARVLDPATVVPRQRLTIVAQPNSQAPRLPFVLFVMMLLVSGLVGLLLLNTALQRGAYAATDLRNEFNALEVRRELLQTKVGGLQDPQRVAQQAIQLGMVQNDSPVFLSLATGSIIGKQLAADEANQVDVGLGTPGAGAVGNGKIDAPVAGAGNTLYAPLVAVAKPDRDRPGQEKPRTDEGKPRG